MNDPKPCLSDDLAIVAALRAELEQANEQIASLMRERAADEQHELDQQAMLDISHRAHAADKAAREKAEAEVERLRDLIVDYAHDWTVDEELTLGAEARAILALKAERDALDRDYQRIIREIIPHARPASTQPADQLEPPWDVIARLVAERDALIAKVARYEDLISAASCGELTVRECDRYCSHGHNDIHEAGREIRAAREKDLR